MENKASQDSDLHAVEHDNESKANSSSELMYDASQLAEDSEVNSLENQEIEPEPDGNCDPQCSGSPGDSSQHEAFYNPEDPKVNEALTKFGITPERIQAVREGKIAARGSTKGSHRFVHMKAISSNDGAIVADLKAEFPSAQAVLKWLLAHGHAMTANNRPIRRANAIGDALGLHGLKLPFLVIDGKKRYAILYANSTDAQKKEAQEHLDNLTDEQVEALRIA